MTFGVYFIATPINRMTVSKAINCKEHCMTESLSDIHEGLSESVSTRSAWFECAFGFEISFVIPKYLWHEKSECKYAVVNQIAELMDADVSELRHMRESDPLKFSLLLSAVREMASQAYYQKDVCDFVVKKLCAADNPEIAGQNFV